VWDQATLLKQIEVIGWRGNAWPITPGDVQSATAGHVLHGTTSSEDSESQSVKPLVHHDELTPAIRSWPKPFNIYESTAMDPVPVAANLTVQEPPAPPHRPPLRTIVDLVSGTGMNVASQIRRPAFS
jgi:hypothetical protein